MFVQVCLHYKQHFRLSTYFRSSCSYGLWLFYFLPLLSLSLPRLNSAKSQLWFYLTDAFKKDQKQLDDSSIGILEEFITFSLCFLFYICFFFLWLFLHNSHFPIFIHDCLLQNSCWSFCQYSCSQFWTGKKAKPWDIVLRFLFDCSSLKSKLT